jgi:transposase-like protein
VKKTAREMPEDSEVMRCVSIALPPARNIPKTLKLSPEDRALKARMVDEMGLVSLTVRRRGDVYHALASGVVEDDGTGSTARKALLCIVRDAAGYARQDAAQLDRDAAVYERRARRILDKYRDAEREHLAAFGRACEERKRADKLAELLRAAGDDP